MIDYAETYRGGILIIVEGPDGAGKTTLINTLVPWLNEVFKEPWELAPRVVQKDTTTKVDLVTWTDDNLARGFHNTVYDRYRLFSDPIYRTALGKAMWGTSLYDLNWLTDAWDTLLESCNPIIIYCLPPFERVQDNVMRDDDNLVVRRAIDQIYHGYVAQCAMLSARYPVVVYDYTDPASLEDCLNYITLDLQ